MSGDVSRVYGELVRSPAEQEISHARDSRGETIVDKGGGSVECAIRFSVECTAITRISLRSTHALSALLVSSIFLTLYSRLSLPRGDRS